MSPLQKSEPGWGRLCARGLAAAGDIRSWLSGKSNGRKAESVIRQQRTWRLKKLSRGANAVLLLLLLAAGCGGLGYTLLCRSDIFQITAFTVKGNAMLTRQQILAGGELRHGANLLALDAGEAERLLGSHPWVESARVTRVWPSSVHVQVRERRPLALVDIEHQERKELYYLDGSGKVFQPLQSVRDLDYPVLTGDVAADPSRQRIEDEALSVMALDFLKLTARGNQILPSQAVSEVHVSREKGIIVYLIDHPFPIYMGREKIKTRFNLLVKVLAQLYREDKVGDIAEIRMDYAKDKILVANNGT